MDVALNAIHQNNKIVQHQKKDNEKQFKKTKLKKERKNVLVFYAEIPQANMADPTKQVLLFIFSNNGGI